MLMNDQDTGAQTKGFNKNQSQISPVKYDTPATSGQQQDMLRQAEDNGRMHQPY